jgi:predicted DNA-binding transcriptional regulator YafY
MPTNKNAYIRYQALDKCFRDRLHRYYIDDLIDKCEDALLYYNGVGGVSRRQIFEDIKFMESDTGWSIPLERRKDGKKVYYRYKDSNFSINKQPITDEEAQQLRTVILTLSRFRGFPSNEWVEDVISNLEWRFHLRGDGNNIIGFEQNDKLRGLGWLSMCIDAISNHQAIRIIYRNYKNRDREIRMVAHPWYVKQYNNRWFLFAYDSEYSCINNFALDRIISLEVAEDVVYISNQNTDFEYYFDDVIGVTIPKADVKKQKITLQFSKSQFPYVASKPMHHSQEIVNEEEGIITIEVRPTYELEQQILSFGPDVEVLSPDSYREYIKEKIFNNYKKYLPVQKDCTDEDYLCRMEEQDK